jgi:hypothetical protein
MFGEEPFYVLRWKGATGVRGAPPSGSLSFFFGEGNAPLALELPRYLLVAVWQLIDLSAIQEQLEQFRFLLGRKIALIENPEPLIQSLRLPSAFRHGGPPFSLGGVFASPTSYHDATRGRSPWTSEIAVSRRSSEKACSAKFPTLVG